MWQKHCSALYIKSGSFCMQVLRNNIVAAFRGMHVSSVKHSYVWLPRKCDYQKSVTTGQTHKQTDARQSDPYMRLCFAGDTKMILWLSVCNVTLVPFKRCHKNNMHAKYKCMYYPPRIVLLFSKSWNVMLQLRVIQITEMSYVQDKITYSGTNHYITSSNSYF